MGPGQWAAPLPAGPRYPKLRLVVAILPLLVGAVLLLQIRAAARWLRWRAPVRPGREDPEVVDGVHEQVAVEGPSVWRRLGRWLDGPSGGLLTEGAVVMLLHLVGGGGLFPGLWIASDPGLQAAGQARF
ncbi:unnamed protein product [Urochloa humidicola]